MRIDFRNGVLPPNFAVFQPKDNLVLDTEGLHLWCRNGAGAGGMLKAPRAYGTWRVRSRISEGQHGDPMTKICNLLWEADGNWTRDHHEIDFNESGDRAVSNQTEHFGPANSMHHTTYAVDQIVWNTFEVRVSPETVSYYCDSMLRAAVPNESPGVLWNMHLRTEPHYDTESETVMDVRWIEVPD
jgi:hypothetical protein